MMVLRGASDFEVLASIYAEISNMGNDTTPLTVKTMFDTIALERTSGLSARLVDYGQIFAHKALQVRIKFRLSLL